MKQAEFTREIEAYCVKYMGLTNEIARTDVRLLRKQHLARQSGIFISWTGTVRSISTTQGGKATIRITVDKSACSKTSFTLEIDRSHRNYQLFSSATEGKSRISLTGKILVDKSYDFFDEDSLTEKGSMTAPEFMIEVISAKIMDAS